MLYALTLAVLLTWSILLQRRNKLSWHAILTAYTVAVVFIDVPEVVFNLLLGLYKFPTHLVGSPLEDNQLGIIFADTLIIPVAYIIFIHYAVNNNPWRTAIAFAFGFTILERTYLHFGYLQYHRWSTFLSAGLYGVGFGMGARLAAPIASYRPPVPFRVRLVAFGYTAYMWVGALFGWPMLKLYQFKPGLFADIMADDRFADLASGLALAGLSALVLPGTPRHLKPLALASVAAIGASFAVYASLRGWLVYHHWSHFLAILRYAVPSFLIMLYDRWEVSYERQLAQA